jgi:small subunit ribosomal protein S20
MRLGVGASTRCKVSASVVDVAWRRRCPWAWRGAVPHVVAKCTRQRDKRRLRNRLVIGSMRTAVKRARIAVDAGAPEAPELVKTAIGRIDRAVTKGAIKRQTGSRLVSRLSLRTPVAA